MNFKKYFTPGFGNGKTKPTIPVEIDRSNPLTSGLVGAWILNSQGRIADLLNKNHGEIVGPGVVTKPLSTGLGLDFSGDNDNDRINLGSITSSNPLSCSGSGIASIATKLIYDNSVGNAAPRIFDKSTSGFAANGYALSVDTASDKVALYVAGSASVGLLSASSLTSDPTSVVGIITGSHFKYYLNGALDRSVAATRTIPSTTANAAIGNWNHSTDRNFKGGIEYLYIYNREITEEEAALLDKAPYQLLKPKIESFAFIGVGGATAAITGTATASITEADIVTGGKTIIITLTGDTWLAAGTGPIGTTANTQAIIDGIDSAQAEAFGWDAEVKANLVPATDVVRTSSTVATITIPAQAAYNITAQETITVTVPAQALTGATQIVGSPTFTVDSVASGASIPIIMHHRQTLRNC